MKKLYAPTKELALRQLEHGAKVVNITEEKEYYVYEKGKVKDYERAE